MNVGFASRSRFFQGEFGRPRIPAHLKEDVNATWDADDSRKDLNCRQQIHGGPSETTAECMQQLAAALK
jgi:hypothetical protein